MKAIKVVEAGKAEVQDVKVPELKDEHLLVKIRYAALNPTDWKHIDYIPHVGSTVGCDWMGTIEEVGPNVNGSWKKGDRVAGVVQGCNAFNLEDGAFAECALMKEGNLFKVPENVGDEEASTVGVAFATVGLGLYQTLGLPWPGSVPAECFVLVYGGSSATGSIAIQFAKLSGAKVVTTCSKKNFDFVKSLGADEAFDYNDPECAEKIRKYTNDSLHTVLDCIGGDTGSKVSTGSISSKGGQICSIVPGTEYNRKDVRAVPLLAYKIRGEPWKLLEDMPATVEDYQFGQIFFRLAVKLLGEGKVKVHPPRVGKGLEGALDGLDEMRQGKVSGQKLVYSIGA
ncbi:uncharacterized protein LTR77_010116 [Saxophila tyrrhenica]|uniref:Enoyl reductase (ER) domain-containing protein n=1 Tax=Saxophila tyrrhenica TaxID=1690608 RepID=A0AAV9NYJ8_9PEZI|nr:hypothetical protein LTR77_010116 [Saxophila tyrrhenica]